MSGERFRDPTVIRYLLGCASYGPLYMCHCNYDRCNGQLINGSEWQEYMPGDDGDGSESPGTTPGDGGSTQLPGTKPDDGGGNGLPGTNPGEGGSNGLPGNGTKPGGGSKSSFGHVTSPFGHVIMAVALLVTIVIGYLL